MRPQGQAKLGYYPTPPETLKLVLTMLRANPGTTPQLLDPCAGEGHAIAAVAAHLQRQNARPETWCIEVDSSREYTLAQTYPAFHTIDSSYQETVRSHGAWSLLWFNPPFDYTRQRAEDDAGDKDPELDRRRAQRTEHTFAKDLLPNLMPGGVYVSLIPQHIAVTPAILRWHLSNLKDINVFKFPAEEFAAFGQLVIVGVRKEHERVSAERDTDYIKLAADRWEHAPDLRTIAAAGALPTYTVPHTDPPPIFRRKSLEAVELIEFYESTLGTNAHADAALRQRTRPRDGAGFTPIIPLRQGHIASIVASGELGVLPVAGNTVLLKGRATKRRIAHDKHGLIVDETDSQAVRLVDSFETQIITLDREGVMQVHDTVGAFERVMQTYAQEIAGHVARRFPPLYTGRDENNWRTMQPLLQHKGLYGRTAHGLLNTQKTIVDAGVKCARTYGVVHYVAEMGSGKSPIALATVECLNAYPAIVLCPAHLVEKWKREVQDTVPGANPLIIKSQEDLHAFAEHYADPAVKGVAILSKEKAKLGPGWKPDPFVAHYPGVRKRDRYSKKFLTVAPRLQRVAKCPKCGVALDSFDLPKSKPNKCPGTRTVWHKGQWQTVKCNEALYTFGTPGPKKAVHLPNRFAHAKTIRSQNRIYVTYPDPHEDEPKPAMHRWPLADLAVRWVKWGTLIADEVHLYKGKGTDQGRAFHVLAGAAKYVISLTGTIFGGKAPDLFYLLYRTNRDFRHAFRYGAEQYFTELYGRHETHLAPEETDRYGRTTGKRRREISVRAIPGISPAIYRWCLPTMLITSLKDLKIPLPPYSEEIIRLEMAPFQAAQYRWVDHLLAEKIKKGFASFDKTGMREAAALMAVYLQTTLSRPNSAFRTEEVWWKPKPEGKHEPYYVSRGASPVPAHMGDAFANPATSAFTADDLNLGDNAHEEEEEENFYDDPPPNKGASGSRNGTHTNTRQARATDRSTPGVQNTPPPGMEILTLHPVAPFEELLPKEQELLRLVRAEVNQGRRVLIYVRQTGTRDIQPRLQHILKNAGIRAATLGAVEPTQREAWINAQISVGTQAVIVNPRKVETGLDLVQFQTLIFYELDYSLFTIWQAMRRVWRIGQTKPVKTYFLIYAGTMEDRALTLMGSKVKATKTLYGDTAADALANEAETSDIMAELAKQILAGAPPASDGINSLFAEDTQSAETYEDFDAEPNAPSATATQETPPMPDPQDDKTITVGPGDYTVAAADPNAPPKRVLDLVDIEFFTMLLDRGNLFCMGDNNYGFPDFRAFGDIPDGEVKHHGFGFFEFKSTDGTRVFSWDAGNSMNATPHSTPFSYVRVEKGEPPVSADELRAVLARHVKARERNAQAQEETARAEAIRHERDAQQAAENTAHAAHIMARAALPFYERWPVILLASRDAKTGRRKESSINIEAGAIIHIDAAPYHIAHVSNFTPDLPEHYEIHLYSTRFEHILVVPPSRIKAESDQDAYIWNLRPGTQHGYDADKVRARLAAQAQAENTQPGDQDYSEEDYDDYDTEPDDGEPEEEILDPDDDDDYLPTQEEAAEEEDDDPPIHAVDELFENNNTAIRVVAITAGPTPDEDIITLRPVRDNADDSTQNWTRAELAAHNMHFVAAPPEQHEPHPAHPGPKNIAAAAAAQPTVPQWLAQWHKLADAAPETKRAHLDSISLRLLETCDDLDVLHEVLAVFEHTTRGSRIFTSLHLDAIAVRQRIAEIEAAAAQPTPEPTQPPITDCYIGETFEYVKYPGKTLPARIFRGINSAGYVTVQDPDDPDDVLTTNILVRDGERSNNVRFHNAPRPEPEPEPKPPPPDPFADIRWLIDAALTSLGSTPDDIEALDALITDGGAMFEWWNDLIFELRARGETPPTLKPGQIRAALREAVNTITANHTAAQQVEGTRLTFNSLKSWVAAWRAVEIRRAHGDRDDEKATLHALTAEMINASTDADLLGQLRAILKKNKLSGTANADPYLQELDVAAQNRIQQLTTPPQPPRPPAAPETQREPAQTEAAPPDPFHGLAFYAPPLPNKRTAIRDQVQAILLARLREIADKTDASYATVPQALKWAKGYNATPQARKKLLDDTILRRWQRVPGINNPGDEDVQTVLAHLVRHWTQLSALSAADAWAATHSRAQHAARRLRTQIKDAYEADLRGGVSILPAAHAELNAYIATAGALAEIRTAMKVRRIEPPHLPIYNLRAPAAMTPGQYVAWATGAAFFGAEEADDYAGLIAWRNSDDFQHVASLRGLSTNAVIQALRKHHTTTYPQAAAPPPTQPDTPTRKKSFAEEWAARQGINLAAARRLADGEPAAASTLIGDGD